MDILYIVKGIFNFVVLICVLRYVWIKRGEKKQREIDMEYENMKRAYKDALKEHENNTSK